MAENVCDLKECPDCASTNVVCSEARQQLVCRDCGLIYTPFAAPAKEAFEEKPLVKAKAKKALKAKKPKSKPAKKAKKR